MPKKPNFLGGMQNYNPNNGEYEPALVGADGKVPQSFKSFKKGDEKNDAFDDINEKRMGKKKSKKEEQPKKKAKSEPKEEKVEEEKVEVNEYEISEALADYQYQVTDTTTAGEYAEEVAKKLGTSKEKVFNVIKAQAPEEIKETSNMSNIISAYETGDDFKDEEPVESVGLVKQGQNKFKSSAAEADYNSVMANPEIYLDNKQIEKIKNLGTTKDFPYDTVLSSVAAYMANGVDAEEAIKKAEADLDKSIDLFGKPKKDEPKPKSLNDFTDELFEKVGVKTFNSKKYKNKEGEIVEIRRFGEGQNAIRYNETKDIVEQVWYNGEKIY